PEAPARQRIGNHSYLTSSRNQHLQTRHFYLPDSIAQHSQASNQTWNINKPAAEQRAPVTTLYMQLTIKVTHMHIICGRLYHRYYHHGYEQHSLASPVGNTFTQAPVVSPINTTSTEPIAVDGRNGFVTMPPGQPLIYRSGVEGDYGQPTSPTVEFNVDELLEYQRRRSSATSEEKEPLTPAQRRRKAQNRAAYVSRSPSFWRDFPLTRRGGHSQRAFRDRKRQRVQDLEAQLSALEVRTNSLESDNERLKHELLLTRDENEVLRSITQPQHPSNTLQPDRRRRTMKAGGTDLHLPLQ
ncbi:hypothetical protein D6C99_05408, partial [Aureobasidium pullulans]